MPTYEYECTKCGYNFEVFQAMSDEPIKTCAKCGKEVRRLILGGAGVIFKGSGFYVTDKAAGKAAGKGTDNKAAATESKTAELSVAAQNAASPGSASSEGSASPTAGDSKKTADSAAAGTKPAAQTT